VARLAQAIPMQHILFGSHYPLFYFESALFKVREAGFADAEARTILNENASRLVGREQ